VLPPGKRETTMTNSVSEQMSPIHSFWVFVPLPKKKLREGENCSEGRNEEWRRNEGGKYWNINIKNLHNFLASLL